MTREQKVGLFFIVGVLLVFVAIEFTVGTGLLDRGYHVWTEYDNVQGLNSGDQVLVAGVRMGSVDRIEVGAEAVRVRLRLQRGAGVRRDAVARLDYQALSGTRFVSISLGSPKQPVLQDGETLIGEQPPGLTDMVDELDGVATAITDLAESLNRNQEELLQNLNRLVVDNQQHLTMALANLESITEKLDQGQGTMAKLLNDPALYDRASAVLANLQELSGQLARGDGTLGRLVYDDQLYDEVRGTVASLRLTVDNLQDISDNIRQGQGTLGRLVVDESLYVEAQEAVRSLDRVAAGIENQAPISILGTFVSTLF